MVVLGIDPGTAHTGYGVVARHGGRLVALDGGVIETAARAPMGTRLALIHERVGALADEYEPAALAVEDVYFGAAFDVERLRQLPSGVDSAARLRLAPVVEGSPIERLVAKAVDAGHQAHGHDAAGTAPLPL